MPLYDYKCGKCGEIFEVRQSFSDPKLTVHEVCGGPLERLISAPALQFKGTGWYITDYARSGGGKGGAKSEGKASDSKTTSTETKSESKSSDSSSSSTSSSGSSDTKK